MKSGKWLALMVVLLTVVISVAAEEQRFRILVDGQWGFMDESGEVVIEPRFDHAYRYRNGYTVVRRGEYETGKRAFLDWNGELVTGFVFDRAYHFVEGFAMGVVNDRWGFVRPDGSTLGSFRYDAVIPFSEGHAGVRVDSGSDALWGVIDTEGREVLPVAYPRLTYAGEGMWWVGMGWNEWALYSPGGNAPEAFPYMGTRRFADGLTVVSRRHGDDRLYQIMTPAGKVVFESAHPIRSYGEGMMLAQQEGGLRYLDFDGERLNDEVYYAGMPFEEGVARVSVGTSWSNQKWGILGADGRYLMPPRYDSLAAFNAEGIARYRIGDRFGFVTREGDEITPPLWDNTGEFAEGLVPVLRDGLWGYVDTSGELSIPLQYDYAWDFGNGYAVVRYGDVSSGQRLYIDPSGERLTGRRFEWAYNFQDGLAHIAEGTFENGSFGYMDREGEVIWEPTR